MSDQRERTWYGLFVGVEATSSIEQVGSVLRNGETRRKKEAFASSA